MNNISRAVVGNFLMHNTKQRSRGLGDSQSWKPALIIIAGLLSLGSALVLLHGHASSLTTGSFQDLAPLTVSNENNVADGLLLAVPPAITLPEGEYRLRNASSMAGDHISRPRVLLYVTTQMSRSHLWYLRFCWPEVLRHSLLLRSADVTVYATPPVNERREALEVLGRAFLPNSLPDCALTVYLRANEEKHVGATSAIWYAVERGLFGGYDWVIRVNPDVIIRDDSFLVTLSHDQSARAMLIDCLKNLNDSRIQVHTDFFAIRPEVLDPSQPFRSGNAELSFTHHLGGSVLRNSEGLRWIPGADPEGPACRAGYGKPMNETPITHFHLLESGLDVSWLKECPIPFVGDSYSV